MQQKRLTGILAPIWSLRHDGDVGIGDLASLRQFLPWVRESGFDFVQLLPIHYLDDSNSPYSAISSVALDPIYLDLSKIPFCSSSPLDGQSSTATNRVDYANVRSIKHEALSVAYEAYLKNLQNQAAFEQFCSENEAWLNDFAIFLVCMERENGSPNWREWDAQYNTPERAYAYITNYEVEHEIVFYQWLQWHCYTQWKELSEEARSMGVRLMGDIPIGVSFNSSDVFFERDNFDLDWYGGAPPETHFKDDEFAIKWGQNWGVPLYHEEHLIQTNYHWWRRRIQKHTEIFSLFRIDHILGIYRIYAFPWHPEKNDEFLHLSESEASLKTHGRLPKFIPHPDDSEEHSKANLARGDAFLAIIIEAAGDAEIIGEDLGFTPDYVRSHLESRHVSGFRVCHWEFDPNKTPLEQGTHQFPYYSFATYSTHDHPPLAAIWEEMRETPSAQADHALKYCAQQPLDQSAPPYSEEIKWNLLTHLLRSSSRYAAFLINDLWEGSERINTPSTVGNHNWTYRIPFTVEEFQHSDRLQMVSKKLREIIHSHRT